MTTFIILAAALTLAAALVIAIPLLRRTGAAAEQASWTAFAVFGVLVFGAAALYATWSNWSWQPQSAATAAAAGAPGSAPDSPDAMVAQLASRLEREPNDLDGWLMLGRSYMALDQYAQALHAYERADALAKGGNAEALTGMAEALVAQDENQLDGRAGDLVERALAIDTRSAKALFLGAAVSMRRADWPKAKERFQGLLALNPPDNIKPILQQQIDAIDQQMGLAPSSPQNTAPPASVAAQPAPTPQNQAPADTGAAVVRVNVSVSEKLRGQVPSSAPLFVFVRDPGRPGPPLAVKRLSSQLPQTVELTAADSMVPGVQFSAGQQVQVVARISRSGSPTAQKGDLFGEVRYQVGRDGLTRIVIDQITP